MHHWWRNCCGCDWYAMNIVCLWSMFLLKLMTETVIVFIVASLLVLFFNVGIPNELKGCLFFIQVRILRRCRVCSDRVFYKYRLWGLSMRAQMESVGCASTLWLIIIDLMQCYYLFQFRTSICLEYLVLVSTCHCVLTLDTVPLAQLHMDFFSHF